MNGESADQAQDPAEEFEQQAQASGLTLPKHRSARWWEVAAILAAIIVVSVGIGAATGWLNLRPASSGPPGLLGTGSCSGQGGQKVSINGTTSTDPDPLLLTSWEELTSRFTADYGNCVKITYPSPGSAGGLAAMSAGRADFAVLTSAPTAQELAALPRATYVIPIGLSSVSIVYDLPGVTALVLNGSTLAAIYEGTISTWDNPAIQQLNPGVDLPRGLSITVVYRSDPAPLNAAFTGYLADSSAAWSSEVGQSVQVNWPVGEGEPGEASAVGELSNVTGSIGYVATGTVLPAAVGLATLEDANGSAVSASAETVVGAAQSSFTANASTIENWTGASLLNAPGNASYPISYFAYLVVYRDLGQAYGGNLTLLAAEWQMTFLWWVATDGGYVTSPLGFDQLPTTIVAPAQLVLEKVDFDGKSVLENSEAGETGGETGEF